MPYTVPSALDLKARYPEFAPVDNALIGAVIDEAAAQVSTRWLERDFVPAIINLAAHMLASEGEPSRTRNGGVVVADLGPIKSVSVGAITTTYASSDDDASQATSGAAPNQLADTVYGKRYLMLLRKNFAGVVVVNV